MLKFSPIKPNPPLPKRLIYKQGDKYTMFSTKTGEELGYMFAKERFHGKLDIEDFEYYPNKENYVSLFINGLFAKVKNKGVGRDFIQFAKHLADNPRCEKRVAVFAMNTQETTADIVRRPSSLFYRKCGFSSAEKPGLDDVDRVLKGLKPLNGDWYCTLPMYLPVK